MKKRVAYFDIDGGKIGGKDSDFDISFDISYMGNTLVPLASRFTIDNLSQPTMNYIATNTTLFEERAKRHIIFYCGYEDNVKPLFDGEISKAQPSGQPDTSLNITAWSSTRIMGNNTEVKKSNTTYSQLIKDAADQCGYKCFISPELEKDSRLTMILPEFSYTGSQYNYLRRVMSDVTGFNVIKGQILFCIANGVLTASISDTINTQFPIKEINMNTGLIGVPEPTTAGINLRVLLDVTASAGQTIKLESKLMPIYNGLYNIWGVTHHGSLRGKDFYTDLICQRVFNQGEYGVMKQ